MQPLSDSAYQPLAQVRIVLVQPAGARNLGSIARVMKNMGFRQWVLVDPQCDPLAEEALAMAVHGADLLPQAQRVQTLPEALQGCVQVVGTTGRSGPYPPEWRIQSPRQVFPTLLAHLARGPVALVFGPEDRGLSNAELALCQHHVQIPTAAAYPSLNLAQAVGICCYELRTLLEEGVAASSSPLPLAPFEVVEGFFQHLERLLLHIGYLHPHTAERKMRKFRALFQRAGLTMAEVALLRGILRQLGWAHSTLSASRQLPPPDLGS